MKTYWLITTAEIMHLPAPPDPELRRGILMSSSIPMLPPSQTRRVETGHLWQHMTYTIDKHPVEFVHEWNTEVARADGGMKSRGRLVLLFALELTQEQATKYELTGLEKPR